MIETLSPPAISFDQARAAAALRHPNLLPIAAVDLVNGEVQARFQHDDGVTLDRLPDLPLDHARAATLGIGILAGLQALQRAGLGHGALAPASVQLSPRGQARLTGYGRRRFDPAADVAAAGRILCLLVGVDPNGRSNRRRLSPLAAAAVDIATGAAGASATAARMAFGDAAGRIGGGFRIERTQAGIARLAVPGTPALAAAVDRVLAGPAKPAETFTTTRPTTAPPPLPRRQSSPSPAEAAPLPAVAPPPPILTPKKVVEPVPVAPIASAGALVPVVTQAPVVKPQPAVTPQPVATPPVVVTPPPAAPTPPPLTMVAPASSAPPSGRPALSSRRSRRRGILAGVAAAILLVFLLAVPHLQDGRRAASPVSARPTPAAVGSVAAASGTPAVAMAAQPDAVITGFYSLAQQKRFDQALALWDDHLKTAYPPQENLYQRFADTTVLTVNSASVSQQTDTSASVATDLTEVTAGVSHHWIGSWRLVRSGNAWLLDQPDFQAA